MTYELAKQLKDAGFPQEGSGLWVDENNRLQSSRSSSFEIYNPTLSELIEACESFRFTKRIISGRGSNAIYEYEVEGYEQSRFIEKSPEEAVAKLWLELNKKI